MPRFLERKLRAEYSSKGLKGKSLERAVFGTMNNMGVMRSNKETPKGVRMDAKHVAKTGHPHRNLGTFLHPKKGR